MTQWSMPLIPITGSPVTSSRWRQPDAWSTKSVPARNRGASGDPLGSPTESHVAVVVLESGHPTLELNHAPGPEHREGHLIPGAELGPALPHLLEAHLVHERDPHGGEHDVSAQGNVLAVNLGNGAAGAKPNGLGGRLLGHFLYQEPKGLREVEVLSQVSADPEPGDAAPEGAPLEHELARHVRADDESESLVAARLGDDVAD